MRTRNYELAYTRGFVLINKLVIYLFSNFCHNKANILYYIIVYYMLHPIIYNTCYFSYILKYSMFTFDFPPFSPFVCQTRPFSRETFSSRKKISLRNRRVYGPLYTYAPLYCVNAPTRIVFKKDFFSLQQSYEIV